MYALNGLNGPWAQDPPHYARVDDFSSTELLDSSRTTIEDWRGWRHQRAVYFVHEGPVIVVDEARRLGGGQSALSWHLGGLEGTTEAGVWLRKGDAPVRLALSTGSWPAATITGPNGPEADAVRTLIYAAPDSGRLNLVTAFLMNGWAEADYEIHEVRETGEAVGQYVHVSIDARRL